MDKILAAFLGLTFLFSPPVPVSFSPLAKGENQKEWSNPTVSKNLANVVDQSLRGAPGKYRIYIRHLATGESFTKDQNDVILSGSMYKAWLVAGVLDDIRIGKLSENQILTDSVENLNEWAELKPEDAELSSGTMKFTVSDALARMIAVSHNYAAFLLTREVGNPKVQKLLKDENLMDVNFVRPPTVSPAAMALFLEKVYRGEFFDDEKYNQEFRDLLASNELNDGLPKLLPKDVRVEHKTGEINAYKHDCGIVYSKGGDYIICVMTESKVPLKAEEQTAKTSLAVYKYFNP